MGTAHSSELDRLVHSAASGSEPAIRAAVQRLGRELKSRLDRGSSESHDFFVGAVRALTRIKGTANAEARFECLFDCAQYFYVAGYGSAALEVAHHLRVVAGLSRNRALERKAYGFSGIVHNDVGDRAQAVADLTNAAVIAREIGDIAAEYRAISNLGVSLMDAGLYQEALPCFKLGLTIPEPFLSTTDILSTALANIAKIHLHLGNFSSGLPLIARAIEVQGEPTDAITAMKRTFREYIYVLLALELGKLNLARERAKECFRYARFGNTPRSLALADMANGLCEIYGGSIDKGVQILELMATRKDLEVSFVVDTMPALIKAYDAAGRVADALAHLQGLLSLFQSTRKEGIQALLDARYSGPISDIGSDDRDALKSLRVLEADLRAKVAEREAISWRIEMFERLASTADLKEEASGEHSYRVGRLSALLAAAIGWDSTATFGLDLAARLHDIGKIAIPDRILLSTTELRHAEREFITSHTRVGAELLGSSQDPLLRMAEEIARHHHEWWNGEGYPSKLKGKRIPIHARIVALADVFDALTHGRPFSPPWPIDKALDEIRARKGTQFDPELTDVFLELVAKLRTEHQDLDEYLGRAGRNSPFLMARNKIRAMLAEERDLEKKATVEGTATHH